MKFSIKHLSLAVLFSLGASTSWAQLPKIKPGAIKEKATGAVQKEATGGASDATQKQQQLEQQSKNVQESIAKCAWDNDSDVFNVTSTLKSLATSIYKCNSSVNPGEKLLAKQYLEKYNGYLSTYQTKADLTRQRIDPPIAEDAQKSASEAYTKMVYAFRQLTIADAKSKSSWGDHEFVKTYKDNLDQVKDYANKYKAADADDYGKHSRYLEAIKPSEKLYEERKDFPNRRDAASKFLSEHSEQYRFMNKAAPGFEDHLGFEKAVAGFEWAEMKKHTDFMHEWGMRPSGNLGGSPDEILDWVDEWPVKMKSEIQKQLDQAKSNASSMKYDYSKWQAAERGWSLSKSASIIYPKESSMTAAVAPAKTLRDERFKQYEASTFTSEYHKSNVNSVGISTTGANGFKPATSFKAGDKVVITIFLDRPVELISKEGIVSIGLSGIWDNEESEAYTVQAADLGKSYIDIQLMNDKPYDRGIHQAEEIVLRELCMASGKTVSPKISATMVRTESKNELKPTTLTFDGTNTAGIATYKTRWTSLNGKRLADVRIPGASGPVVGVDSEYGKVFKDKYGPEDVKSVLKIKMLDSDWTVRRNQLTGIIVARERSAWVAYQRVDGSCRVEEAWFKQDAQDGSKYGPSYFSGVGNNFEIHCGNVDK